MRYLIVCMCVGALGCTTSEATQPFNASVASTSMDPALGVGLRAPVIEATYLSGSGAKTLAEARGKIVVLDFWASWCLPCMRSFPAYERLSTEFPNEVSVITISIDSPDDVRAGKVREFISHAGATFPVLWDEHGASVAAYRPKQLPSAYIIGRDGFIRSVHIGYEDREDLRIEADVRLMLGK